MEDKIPQRKHPRLKTFDYSTPGGYFVTICTQDKKCLLSRIVGRGFTPAENVYTPYGEIAEKQLFLLEKRYAGLRIDQYVIMPNHIHVIFILEDSAAGASPRPTLTDIVCAYKSLTTRACKKYRAIDKLFQTSFYEHVIRGWEDYDEIAKYICQNPARWQLDKLYTET